MADFLLEIGTEEMPAHDLGPACAALRDKAMRALTEQRVGFQEVVVHATPRRLVLWVQQIADRQQDLEKWVRGPAVAAAFDGSGQPTRAAEGFARSQGVPVDELIRQETENGAYVFVHRLEPGRPTSEVLSNILPDLIADLPFARTMRWGDGDFRFVRPIRWLLALLGDQALEFTLAGVPTDSKTFGHRTLAPQAVTVRSVDHYFDVLRERFVVLDAEERREMIVRQAQRTAREAGGRVKIDEDLLQEVTYLVEYPTAFLGHFHEDYLVLPKEVLITTMATHQRYFPVAREDGSLLPMFVGVRNGGDQHLENVIAGNEKVIRARLADARFFFDEDLQIPLEGYVPRLEGMVYQEGLGTMREKTKRLEQLAKAVAEQLGLERQEQTLLLRSAALCKADLVTHLVYEFPELQGIMGREYALRSGEDPAVAQAIHEHYLPTGSGGELPQSRIGALLALCDKVDAIVGNFSIGIQPTGSQDPYGLRRQALGILRILHQLEEQDTVITLGQLLEAGFHVYQSQLQLQDTQSIKNNIYDFIGTRLKILLSEQGYAAEVIDAVLARGFDRPRDTWLRTHVLDSLWRNNQLEDLLTIHRRCSNLAEKADAGQSVNPDQFVTEWEINCYEQLHHLQPKANEALQAGDYPAYFQTLAQLRQSVDQLLDRVMIMDENQEIRRNRLALLREIRDWVCGAADLGRLPG